MSRTGESEPSNADGEATWRRGARALGAVTAVAGLAGCADLLGGGGDGGSGDGPGGGDGGSTADPTATESCASRRESLEDELETLEGDLDRANGDLESMRGTAAELEAKRGQYPDGHPESRVQAAKEVGRSVRESVVVVQAGGGRGTGWVVDDGHVLTNAHNLIGPREGERGGDMTGIALDGTEFDLELVAAETDMQPDVALLAGEFSLPALEPGASADLEAGQPLVTVGHPGGVGYWVVSMGLFVSVDQGGRAPESGETDGMALSETLQTGVPGRVGNSGSPLVTLDGQVVGMVNGSEVWGQTTAGNRPQPTEPVVYDWPLAPHAWTTGPTIEVTMETYREWV